MSLSYHARTFIVESPLWDQVLHRQRVITRAQGRVSGKAHALS